MLAEVKLTYQRLSILELAEVLGDVSETCRQRAGYQASSAVAAAGAGSGLAAGRRRMRALSRLWPFLILAACDGGGGSSGSAGAG